MTLNKISEIKAGYHHNMRSFDTFPQITSKAEEIVEQYGLHTLREPPNMDEIIRKAEKVYGRNAEEGLTNAELLHMAGAFLSPKLLERGDIHTKLLNDIETRSTKRPVSALFVSYIIYFDKTKPLLGKVAKFLLDSKLRMRKRLRKSADMLLDYANVEESIADLVIEHKSEEVALENIGLSQQFSDSGLMRGSMIALAKQVRKKISNGDYGALNQFINIVCNDDRIKEGRGIPAIIGLLAPFIDKSEIPSDIKNRLQDIFIKSFSDPTLNEAEWPEIPKHIVNNGPQLRKDCIAMMTKWLISDKIDLFLEIIEKSANSHQFEKRKALWRAYFNENHVDEAHIVLGPRARRMAERIVSDKGITYLRWGKLSTSTSSSSDPSQSVLLMRISNLVISEWSHNRRFRVWYEDAKLVPELYKDRYTPKELTSGSNRIRTKTTGSYRAGIVHTGDWTERVEQYIRQETGIVLKWRYK